MLQQKKQEVYLWESLRQISKVSKVHLASVIKTKTHDLEEAARLRFRDHLPAGAVVPAASAPASYPPPPPRLLSRFSNYLMGLW